MSRPDRHSGPAAGVLNALIISAGLYGLVVVVALAAGRNALLMCLLLLIGLLHACLTGLRRSAVTMTTPPVTQERSAPNFLAAK
jgi:hypothetical protein